MGKKELHSNQEPLTNRQNKATSSSDDLNENYDAKPEENAELKEGNEKSIGRAWR